MAASYPIRTAHVIAERDRTSDVLTEENANVDFASMFLSKPVSRGLEKVGFEKPSPIQLKAIPLGRCGLDLIVQAKSGTGKTCVFSVVALESLDLDNSSTQVLVLAPTREIAVQIQETIQAIGCEMEGLRCHVFIGGTLFGPDRQKLKKCHIAVGSPGRIKQLIEYDVLKTGSLRLFVLDEADKLLDDSFQEQVNWIYNQLPDNKQMLALSATYPEYLAKQLIKYMRDPMFVRLNPKDIALQGIKQMYAELPGHSLPNKSFEIKVVKLLEILTQVSFNQCLIFSNLQTRAQNLCDILCDRGWPSECISGNQEQAQRMSAMAKLKRFQCRILISTDLTARGIDAENVNLIINLDIPTDTKTYLHRIGRAGRFGTHGAAISLASRGKEIDLLKNIQRQCGVRMALLPDPAPSDLLKHDVLNTGSQAVLLSSVSHLDSLLASDGDTAEGPNGIEMNQRHTPATDDARENDIIFDIPRKCVVMDETKKSRAVEPTGQFVSEISGDGDVEPRDKDLEDKEMRIQGMTVKTQSIGFTDDVSKVDVGVQVSEEVLTTHEELIHRGSSLSEQGQKESAPERKPALPFGFENAHGLMEIRLPLLSQCKRKSGPRPVWTWERAKSSYDTFMKRRVAPETNVPLEKERNDIEENCNRRDDDSVADAFGEGDLSGLKMEVQLRNALMLRLLTMQQSQGKETKDVRDEAKFQEDVIPGVSAADEHKTKFLAHLSSSKEDRRILTSEAGNEQADRVLQEDGKEDVLADVLAGDVGKSESLTQSSSTKEDNQAQTSAPSNMQANKDLQKEGKDVHAETLRGDVGKSESLMQPSSHKEDHQMKAAASIDVNTNKDFPVDGKEDDVGKSDSLTQSSSPKENHQVKASLGISSNGDLSVDGEEDVRRDTLMTSVSGILGKDVKATTGDAEIQQEIQTEQNNKLDHVQEDSAGLCLSSDEAVEPPAEDVNETKKIFAKGPRKQRSKRMKQHVFLRSTLGALMTHKVLEISGNDIRDDSDNDVRAVHNISHECSNGDVPRDAKPDLKGQQNEELKVAESLLQETKGPDGRCECGDLENGGSTSDPVWAVFKQYIRPMSASDRKESRRSPKPGNVLVSTSSFCESDTSTWTSSDDDDDDDDDDKDNDAVEHSIECNYQDDVDTCEFDEHCANHVEDWYEETFQVERDDQAYSGYCNGQMDYGRHGAEYDYSQQYYENSKYGSSYATEYPPAPPYQTFLYDPYQYPSHGYHAHLPLSYQYYHPNVNYENWYY